VTIDPAAEQFAIDCIQRLAIPSHRAEIALFEAARARAAADFRLTATIDDIRRVAILALRQRRSVQIDEYAAAVALEDAAIEQVIKSNGAAASPRRRARKKSSPDRSETVTLPRQRTLRLLIVRQIRKYLLVRSIAQTPDQALRHLVIEGNLRILRRIVRVEQAAPVRIETVGNIAHHLLPQTRRQQHACATKRRSQRFRAFHPVPLRCTNNLEQMFTGCDRITPTGA
jgi:Mg-chelatase subunit ChlI